MSLLGFLSAAALAPAPTAAWPVARPVGARAVTIGDGYARRLTIHRIGSYAMLAPFATQYLLGDAMLVSMGVSTASAAAMLLTRD